MHTKDLFAADKIQDKDLFLIEYLMKTKLQLY